MVDQIVSVGASTGFQARFTGATFRGDTARFQHGKVSQAGSSCSQVAVKPTFMAAEHQRQWGRKSAAAQQPAWRAP